MLFLNIDSFKITINMRTREGNKEKDILKSAIEVFAQTGYHDAKISRIAENAGVATGSIYLYFKNKEELLARIFETLWEKLYCELNAIQTRTDLNSIEKLEGLLDLIFDIFTDNPSLATVFANDYYRHTTKIADHYFNVFLQAGEELIVEGINKKVFNPNINVLIFRHFVLGGVSNLLHQWADNPKDFPLNVIRQNLKFIVKRGILIVQ